MNRIHRGHTSKGKLRLADREAFMREVEAMGDCDVEVILRKVERKRSLDQNAFYHGIIVPRLSEHTGYEKEELHTELKRRFINGRSTTTLNTTEFCRFVEDCQRLGSELGCYIPDPNEVEV